MREVKKIPRFLLAKGTPKTLNNKMPQDKEKKSVEEVKEAREQEGINKHRGNPGNEEEPQDNNNHNHTHKHNLLSVTMGHIILIMIDGNSKKNKKKKKNKQSKARDQKNLDHDKNDTTPYFLRTSLKKMTEGGSCKATQRTNKRMKSQRLCCRCVYLGHLPMISKKGQLHIGL